MIKQIASILVRKFLLGGKMDISEGLGQWLIIIFTQLPFIGDAAALYLAILLIIWALYLGYNHRKKYYRPLADAIMGRIDLIKEITGRNSDEDEARLAFARRFNDIDEMMMSTDNKQVEPLQRNWEEYRETIVDPSAEVLQNTARPEIFFLALNDRHRGLNWYANIVIAIGLLITFLGIIAALSTLDLKGGVDAMQSSLNELMQVAGAKFWASVGGIFASIIIRTFDYRYSNRIEENLNELCDLLEHGMMYLPPQRIAIQQLRQLEEQTPALRTFSDQLAVALEGALEKQMVPMISHLGSIQEGIEKISGGGNDAVKEAIASGAGAEMSGLADAISSMTLSMVAMSDRMEKQSGEADRQIEDAIRRFGQASEEMRTAFGELNRNFDTIAERMRADSEEASEQTRTRMSALIESLGSTMDEMKNGLSTAAGEMGAASANAAQDAARVGQEALESSFASFTRQFTEAGKPLVESMKDAGQAITTSSDNLVSAQSSIGDHARAIESVASRSSDLATAFGSVADDVQAATLPVRGAADAIAKAIKSMELIIAAQATTANDSREEMVEMATALSDTARAAETAWSEYRGRFEQVDRSLGEAIDLITNASSQHAQNLNDRVGQVDKALGDGVAQLAGALKPLATLRDTVEELAGALAQKQIEVDK